MKKPSPLLVPIRQLGFLFALLLTHANFGALPPNSWSVDFNDTTQNGTFYPRDGFLGSPAVGVDGTIYIAGVVADANGFRRLYAINPTTGAILPGWPVLLGERVNPIGGPLQDKGAESSPAIGPDGKIYIGSWNYSVYKVDPVTRIVTSWTPRPPESDPPDEGEPRGVLRTAPIVANGLRRVFKIETRG